MRAVLQKLHQYTKLALQDQDFPCAICGVCKSQLNEFHAFRMNVVRNHNAVKIFRQTFGDEIECVEPEKEEEQTFVEIIEDSILPAGESLADIIQDEYGDTTELKEVDVYHVNGELRTVVVKPDSEAPPPQVRVSPKKTPPAARVNILNKSGGHAASLPAVQKSIPKAYPSGTVFTVFKCTTCRAVFQNQDNLTNHQRKDHPSHPETPPQSALQRLIVHKVEPRKSPQSYPPKRPLLKRAAPPQTQKLLFKCASCSSSFVEEQNLKHHQITCKPAALSKLNLSQITIKRTKVQEPAPAASRIQCEYCKLTYKTQHFLNKHLLEVHKVMPQKQPQHFCSLCKLSYSCLQDLQLHNRAMHAFRCTTCAKDFRQCLHEQPNIARGAENNNGVGGNKAANAT